MKEKLALNKTIISQQRPTLTVVSAITKKTRSTIAVIQLILCNGFCLFKTAQKLLTKQNFTTEIILKPVGT